MKLTDRIGRRMKLQDLHVFLTVVNAGSMGKAAAILNSTQPNITRSIAALEHTLGVRLLDRNYRGVELTDFGRALLKRSQIAFDELRASVKDIEFLADPTAGELRIGSITYLAASFITAVIDRLSVSYPRMNFNVLAGDTATLHRALTDRNVDFVLAQRFGAFSDEYVNFEKLYEERYVVLGGVKNRWVRRKKVDLADLLDEPWTLSSQETVIGMVAKEAFSASGLPYPRVTVTKFPKEMRMNLLLTGRFLTISPTSDLRLPIKRSEFKALAVKLPIASIPIGVITLKNRPLNNVGEIFLEHAREVAQSIGAKR
jgi:DNA-binding transcriptional LysR family regulator